MLFCWVVHCNPTLGFAQDRAHERGIELKEWFFKKQDSDQQI